MTPQWLRTLADEPAASGFVPIHPDTLRGLAAMLAAAPPPAADAVSVDALMEMAQEYASAWSLVGGPFDRGDMLDEAEDAKERLRRAIAAAFAARRK